MRFRLRTLLIVLAILPPLLAVGWWKYVAWRTARERQSLLLTVPDGGSVLLSTGDISP